MHIDSVLKEVPLDQRCKCNNKNIQSIPKFNQTVQNNQQYQYAQSSFMMPQYRYGYPFPK